tara:strand:- start:1548 stop:2639 length:1092 start_codon:yes stop_codon:yes gene_type:complete
MFLISTRNFPPDIGGIQNLMEGLSLALLNHGPVKIFADKSDNCEQYDESCKLNIERVSGFKIFRKYRKANLVNDFINNNNLRAIFFDHWKSIENVDPSSLKKTRSFCLIHSKEINHKPGSTLNKRMLSALAKANYIVANSKFTQNLVIELGYKNSNVKVINPGCFYPKKIDDSSKEFARTVYGNASPKLITVSRLDGRKSHQNILMTIKNLLPKFPNLKYVSIGDGDEKDKLEKLTKELGINSVVTFIYKSSEQEKLSLIEMSDVFIMPSVIHKKSVEGFGISYIEAASYGKPSIGGIFGGEADAIIEGQTGYLCDGNDLNALYETLVKTLSNDHHLELGKNALKFSQNFSWDKIVKKYIELI